MIRFVLSLLVAATLMSGAFLHAAAAPAAKSRPNILLIYADDQSYKTLGCYDESPDWVRTPNIDALAARGVRFERSYLGAWCMPSRASILTGKLQHGVQTMRMEGPYPASTYDPAQCPFIPAQFRQQGYHTAQIGKWHTGVDTGYGRDWDYQIVWNRPGHPDNAGKYFYNQIVTVNGVDRVEPGYSTDTYTNWAEEYIRGEHRDGDKPWYLWLCYGAVHGPTTPADRHKGHYQRKHCPGAGGYFRSATREARVSGRDAIVVAGARWATGNEGQGPRAASNFDTIAPGLTLNAWVQQMNECMLAVDEGVGRLMTTLQETGQFENTLVIYVADQGYGLGEHGFNQKVAPYDATIASPLILARPDVIPTGKVCKQPVNAPDLMHYVCQSAQVNIPWGTHGRDISPLIQEPDKANWDSPMLFTHTARMYGNDTSVIPTDPEHLSPASNTPWYVMLRDGQYKYIRNLTPGETEELYDLAADPEELRNLAFVADQRARLERLRSLAIAELRRTGAGFVDTMPVTRQMQAK